MARQLVTTQDRTCGYTVLHSAQTVGVYIPDDLDDSFTGIPSVMCWRKAQGTIAVFAPSPVLGACSALG